MRGMVVVVGVVGDCECCVGVDELRLCKGTVEEGDGLISRD